MTEGWKLFAWLRTWLRQSSHVHLRERRVANFRDLVDLVDRFVDDALVYDLEWDDFISWKNENRNVEEIRDKIAALEPMFFSADPAVKQEAMRRLAEQRNLAAGLIGLPSRDFTVVPDT